MAIGIARNDETGVSASSTSGAGRFDHDGTALVRSTRRRVGDCGDVCSWLEHLKFRPLRKTWKSNVGYQISPIVFSDFGGGFMAGGNVHVEVRDAGARSGIVRPSVEDVSGRK